MILIYAGLIWDCIDVTLDAKYFLDLENPDKGVLDPRVYRNTHALNAIYAFSLIGILKIPVSVMLLTDGETREATDIFRCFNSLLIFLAQDCVENFLQYFYGEKYSMDGQYAWYMVGVDAVLILILIAQVSTIVSAVRSIVGEENTLSKHRMMITVASFTFLSAFAASVIRLSGALYQAITGKIDKGCLLVVDGKLVQNPFTSRGQCMRTFEYFFIVLNFLPILGFIVIIIHTIF